MLLLWLYVSSKVLSIFKAIDLLLAPCTHGSRSWGIGMQLHCQPRIGMLMQVLLLLIDEWRVAQFTLANDHEYK